MALATKFQLTTLSTSLGSVTPSGLVSSCLGSQATLCAGFRQQALRNARLPSVSRNARQSRTSTVIAEADSEGSSTTEYVAAIGGLISAPVVAYSLFVLKTTGCGLPPGPGGSIGALEGVSYLGLVGLVGWSLYTKVKTGSGLPQGPFGLLGAAEGLSYLVLLAAIVVFGFQVLDYGYIPSAVPDARCFG